MSSLDDRLKEIWTGEYRYLDDEIIAQIKDAFAEEHAGLLKTKPNLMTGQEWYERFEPLLEEIDLNSKTRYQEIKTAAKRAAGIST